MSTNRQMARKCLEGVTGDDDLSLGLLREATVHALLDVADAVREQTAALTGDDKRAILVERNQ